MVILGIETSCDETSASLVFKGTKILSNSVSSSSLMHAESGGIIPENAARQQIKSIIPVIISCLKNANGKNKGLHYPLEKIDALAVTVGPGLVGSLLVGVETAKTLSYIWNKPLVPVNHLSAHIYANFLNGDDVNFPLLALVVSGGHTDLVIMSGHGNFQWIGGTLDDAAGEAFDKTARLLGLPYPGGPAISSEAEKYFLRQKNKNIKLSLFPRPLINRYNFDFSFSGLKTSVSSYVNKNPDSLDTEKLSAEVQEAIIDVLVSKVSRAMDEFKLKHFLLSGGVAANSRLREVFLKHFKKRGKNETFYVPKVSLCTDNAAYISSYAYFNYMPISWKNILVNPQLGISKKPYRL